MTPPEPNSNRNLTVALAHDWLVARRGGELVLDAIASHLLNNGTRISQLYTMFDSDQPITPAIDSITRTTSGLNRFPAPLRRWLLPRYPLAVEQLSRRLVSDHRSRPIDLLISTSSAAIKALAPPESIPHICYCHAPARYLWSQTDQYTTQPGIKSKLRAAGLDRFGDSLRDWDLRTASNVTQFIANSHFIASEIKKTYNRDAVVIHPPVRTDYFTPPSDPDAPRTNELLFVGAIEPYKRVDLAIDAAILLDRPINIVGTGSHASALMKTYKNKPKVKFHGHIPDAQVLELFRTSAALIQPQVEDFGITAVEAQACGLPVVARRAGGGLDSVIETKTGTFFDQPDATEVARAFDRLPTHEGIARDCRINALRFSYESFWAKLDAVIASVLN
tara:strand:+ start:135447 stop:136619 length:1173 start_codon:yes stop_codon:yes gene_type:complete